MKNFRFLLLIIPFFGFGQNDSLNQKKDSVLLNLTGKLELLPDSIQLQSLESQRLFRPGVPSPDLRNGKPLFVINGVVKEEIYSIEEIDQDQIVKVTELKGAAATALYGSKARNGVYIIETKNSISDKLENQIPRMGMTSNEVPEIFKIDSVFIPSKSNFPGTVCQASVLTIQDPLYVVDGEITDRENISIPFIKENIESIMVIKGNDAILKYGQKGKYGVIEIHTKDGKAITKYDLAVLDIGYESFLGMQPSALTYSLNYLKNKNRYYVSVWNSRVITGNPDIYDMPIEYDSKIYYGLEFEYKLYQYFKFIENKHHISMM